MKYFIKHKLVLSFLIMAMIFSGCIFTSKIIVNNLNINVLTEETVFKDDSIVKNNATTFATVKTQPTICEIPTNLTGVYSPDKTLGNSYNFDSFQIITEGVWSWEDASVIPEPNQSTYYAKFTPTDTTTYETLTNIEINIKIEKADIAVDEITFAPISYVPGKKLDSLTLPTHTLGVWSWDSPTLELEVKNNQTGYNATFTPTESDKYNVLHKNIKIQVNPIDPKIVVVPTVGQINYNKDVTLSNIPLNNDSQNEVGTWSWVNDTAIPTVVNSGYQAQFTPKIKGSLNERNLNYNIVYKTISIKVNPVEVSLKVTTKSIYTKQPLNESFVILEAYYGETSSKVKGSYKVAWQKEQPLQPGEYPIVITFTPDKTETNFKQTTKVVNINVNPITITFDVAKEELYKEKYTDYNSTIKESDWPANPKKDGYTFEGWFDKDGELTQKTVLTADRTVIAKFNPIPYTITLGLNGGNISNLYSSDLPSGVKIDNNIISFNVESKTIILPQAKHVTKDGYVFTSWTDGNSNTFTQINSGTFKNIVLNANYKLDDVKDIEVEAKGSQSRAYYTGRVVVELEATHKIVPNLHYTYEWYKDGNKIENSNVKTITLTNVSDSANYMVKAKVKDSKEETNFTASVPFKAEVLKATPTFDLKGVNLNNTYTGEVIKLSGAKIDNIFDVDNFIDYGSTEIMIVANYNVTISIPGTENYEASETVVTVTVEKANLTLENIVIKEKIYENQPLRPNMISVVAKYGNNKTDNGRVVNFSWLDDSAPVNNKKMAEVIFKPSNTDNINDKKQQIEVDVYKIEVVFVNGISRETKYTTYDTTVTLPKEPSKLGYTFTSWSDEFGDITKDTLLTEDRVVNAVFTPIQYEIKVDLNNGSCNTTIDKFYTIESPTIVLPTQANVKKDGYTFIGWKKDKDLVFEIKTGSYGSVNLKAVYRLNAPNLSLTGYDKQKTYVYTKDVVVTLNADHEVFNNLNYTYIWYKNGKEIKEFNNKTLDIINVVESGKYIVKVKVTEPIQTEDDYQSTERISEEVNVVINKATPTLNYPKVESFVYEYGKLLSSIVLTNPTSNIDGVWTWKNNNDKTIVKKSIYYATFTPTDNSNYKTMFDQPIEILVQKATPIFNITGLQQSDYKYTGQTIVINKGARSSNTDDNVVLTYYLQTKEGSLVEPKVIDAGTYVIVVASNETDNYKSAKSEGVLVKVAKKDAVINASDLLIKKEYIYTGNDILITGATLNHNECELLYSETSVKDAKSYSINIFAKETKNYNSTYVDITVLVKKADLDIKATVVPIYENEPLRLYMVENVLATYDDGNMVADGKVSKLVWKEGSNIVNGKRMAEMTFTPTDSNNINEKTIDVEISVSKIKVTFVNGTEETVKYTVFNTTVDIPASPHKDGYTFNCWKDDTGIITKNTPLYKSRVVHATYTAIVYNISVNKNKGTISKNIPGNYTIESETIVLPNAQEVEKDGYTFAGWYNGEHIITSIDKGSIGHISLIATYLLNKPTNLKIEGYTKPETYTGSSVVRLYANFDQVANLKYSFAWYKGDNHLTKYTTNTIDLTTVAESGDYRVRIIVDEIEPSEKEAQQEQILSEIVSVVIKPATIDLKFINSTTSENITESQAFEFGSFKKDFFYLSYDEKFKDDISVNWYKKVLEEDFGPNNNSSYGESWQVIETPIDSGEYKFKVKLSNQDNYVLSKTELLVEIQPKTVDLVWENLDRPVKGGKFNVKCYYLDINNNPVYVDIAGKTTNIGTHRLTAIINDINYTTTDIKAEITIEEDKSSIYVIIGSSAGVALILIALFVPKMIKKRKIKKRLSK